MRTPYTQLYCHAVWATWDRERTITEAMDPRIAGAIRAKLEELECTATAIGVMPDHVHMLFGFPPKFALSDVIGKVKGASSHLVNAAALLPGRHFQWQGAYGAFTISRTGIGAVREYVLNQKTHHADNTANEQWELTSEEEAPID